MSLEQALAVIALGVEIASGRLNDPKEIARRIVDLGLALVPIDELAPFLGEAGMRRSEVIVDIAEAAKVGL